MVKKAGRLGKKTGGGRRKGLRGRLVSGVARKMIKGMAKDTVKRRIKRTAKDMGRWWRRGRKQNPP